MSQALESINQTLMLEYLDRYPAEFVRELESLSLKEIGEAIVRFPLIAAGRVVERLSPGQCAEVLQSLDHKLSLQLLNRLDPNRAARLLGSMEDDVRDRYMADLDPIVRKDVDVALTYPPDSAGAIMGTRVVYYTAQMTVGDALERLRRQRKPGVRVIFLVNDDHVLQGMLEIQDLALANHNERLGDLTRQVKAIAEIMTTREELVEIFETQRITELPVIDFKGRMVGIVRHFALINAAKEETSVDIQTMVGVSKDERALSPASFAVKKRLPWLQINLATAFLAATVVGFFEQTIAQVTALAVLLPVVAGQSGNTGAQALAVTMRGLALREIWPRQWFSLVKKELGVGFLNGLAVALTTMAGVYIWSQSVGLCLIIGVSMVLSMVIASVSGTLIPVLLTRAGIDPATSSSIFLTTVTDVMGFLSFLGIATLLMGMI